MSEYYFINQRIVTEEKSAVLGQIDSDIELNPIDLLDGCKLTATPRYIRIRLNERGGDFFPDMFSTPITLVSEKIKKCLCDIGVANVEFYPVDIVSKEENRICEPYWYAHVIGRFSCLDVESSNVKINALGNFKFKSFVIDESKTMGAEVFRLGEKGRMIIINKRVYESLSARGLKGVVMENTKKFDGYGI